MSPHRSVIRTAGDVDRTFDSYLEYERVRRREGLPDHGVGQPVPEGPDAIDDELREEMDRLKAQEAES